MASQIEKLHNHIAKVIKENVKLLLQFLFEISERYLRDEDREKSEFFSVSSRCSDDTILCKFLSLRFVKKPDF